MFLQLQKVLISDNKVYRGYGLSWRRNALQLPLQISTTFFCNSMTEMKFLQLTSVMYSHNIRSVTFTKFKHLQSQGKKNNIHSTWTEKKIINNGSYHIMLKKKTGN